MSELLPCPFCGGDMRITSNRDWHKLEGNHDETCLLLDEVVSVPALDAALADLISDWNRRSLPAAEDAQGWKNAVEDELVICGILNEFHKDPRKAVKDAIAWNVQVALDPLVSEVARDAARYRWLCENGDERGGLFIGHGDIGPWGECGHSAYQYKEHADAAIDAAMSQDSKGEGK